MPIHAGSFTDKLSKLEVGDRLFIEAVRGNYHRIQSQTTHPRVKQQLGDRKFTSQVWTAVSRPGEAVVLVSITRIS